ncbi:hypothetical protein [Sphingobium sp.]|uniref:hypothetical protein n=1 Tax=Sphingobium sp. TaxID=1912891 RepID=UPI002BE17036|nr:hypothetical protein [Sphingobium sp.]HUD95786.1 hypothetical protein [Sphingobium sp.]
MIGTKARWMTGALVSAGLLLGSVSAAEARPRYGYGGGWDRGGWDRHHRHRGDGFGLGDAIGVAAIVGAVAIVANSMSKSKKIRDPRTGGEYDAPPPRAGTDYGSDVRSDAPARDPVRDDADFSDIADANGRDDAMTDACAVAARDEAQGENGGYAEVRRMETPIATADGYNINGYVESRSSYSANDGTSRRFTCSMKNGRVAQVYISRDLVMQ